MSGSPPACELSADSRRKRLMPVWGGGSERDWGVGAKLRVGLVYLGRRGGGALYAFEVARALSNLCNTLCVISGGAENVEAWRTSGLEVVEVQTPKGGRDLLLKTLRFLWNRSIWQRLSSARLDVLYYPMIHVWAPLVNRRFANTPVVTTIHDAQRHVGEKSLVLNWVQNACLRRSAVLITLSRSAASDLIAAGWDSSKIDVLALGHFSWYAGLGTHAGSVGQSDGKTLLYFGRVAAYKGIDVLLEAFSSVRAQVPGCRLVLAGEGSMEPYRGWLRGLDKVDVVNRWIADEEVAGFFQAADVVVLPYVDASQSGVVSIAAALGLPVVASRVGGLAEQVLHGETGLLVEPNDPAALAAACVRLLTDADLRCRLGQAAKARATAEWGWERVAEGVLSACRRAVPDVGCAAR